MLSLHMANRIKTTLFLIVAAMVTMPGNLCSCSYGQSTIEMNFSDVVTLNDRDMGLRDQYVTTVNLPQQHLPDELAYALILPGILGERFWDNNVQAGIRASNFAGQTEIYDWTKGPLMMAANIGGSSRQSAILVQRIVDFKQRFPRRPLYLIGHSGGCRMVVQVLEQLPIGVDVERAILLSPCMESTYDLSRALSKTEAGLVVFYSPLDLAISVPLTVAHGFVQAGRIEQTGATTGFKAPPHLNAVETDLYQNRLIQNRFERSMIWSGNIGGHFGWTVPRFISKYVVPYLASSN